MRNNTVIITRHGRTEWNLEKRLQGDFDSPLLGKSVHQLKELGERIISEYDIDLAYCSTKKRAKDSFGIAFPSICVEYKNELSEISYGIHEGKLLSEVDTSEMNKDPWNTPWQGGESCSDVWDRVNGFLSNLDCENKNVLIMAHEGVNKILVGVLCSLPNSIIVKIRQPNHVCYIVRNKKLRVVDIYGLNYENIVFSNIFNI